MGKTQQAAGGGLTAADRAKLIPENIRKGVVLFEGTRHEVAGTATVMPDEILLSNYGVTFPHASMYLPAKQHTTLTTTSTPEFDVTSYKYAQFKDCRAFSDDESLTIAYQVCQVVQGSAVVAELSGLNRTVDISAVQGFVKFRCSARFYNDTSDRPYSHVWLGDVRLMRE